MNEAHLDNNQLAEGRTEMAFGRTIMALERSLMAWIRTSLSLISFGFTIFKFLEAMHDKGAATIRANAPRNLGLFLIVLGLSTLTMAIFQYYHALKIVEEFSTRRPKFSLSVIGAIGVILVGLFTLANILFGFGGF